MFVLQLNDMRSSNVENLQPVARAETKEELESIMEREKVEGYRDGTWYKKYVQGGLLEWFNPPFSCDNSIVDVGTADDWAANARSQFDHQIMSIPTYTGCG